MRPGSTVACERSITGVPGGKGRAGPTAEIRSPAIRITALRTGAPPSPSISRPARTASSRGGLAVAGAAAAAAAAGG